MIAHTFHILRSYYTHLFHTDKMIAQMIPVQVVGYVDNQIAVAGQGLVPGMDIVSKGNERVFPNSPVKIINK